MPPVEIGPVDGVAIRGGGTAFPALRLSNEEVLRRIGARVRSAEQLGDLGVVERSWAHVPGQAAAADEQSTLALATVAARGALADGGVSASDVALILCATSTPPASGETVAAGVGAAIGAHAACLDIRAGCAAAMFGLATAALHVQAGCGPVLLIGAETFSTIIQPGHQTAALALADGAGAIVLARGRGRLRSAFFTTDGTLAHLVRTDGPLAPAEAALAAGAYSLSGEPEELTDEVPRKYEQALQRVLARAGLRAGDIDAYVPHQTSRALIHDVCRRVGLAPERAFVNIERHANIGAAGWLVALVEARREGRLRPGARLALASVGGGMSSAAAMMDC